VNSPLGGFPAPGTEKSVSPPNPAKIRLMGFFLARRFLARLERTAFGNANFHTVDFYEGVELFSRIRWKSQ
jgi:hypothetical protein